MCADVDKSGKSDRKFCIHQQHASICWCTARFASHGLVNGQVVEIAADGSIKRFLTKKENTFYGLTRKGTASGENRETAKVKTGRRREKSDPSI